MDRLERCVRCHDATGRAGAADDSLFIEQQYAQGWIKVGPLCSDCYNELLDANGGEPQR